MTWGNWPAFIALIAAVLSPFMTATLNNAHQRKMKNIEMYTERRLNALQNYLARCSAVMRQGTSENLIEYGKAYGNVQIFLSENAVDCARALDNMFAGAQFQGVTTERLYDDVRNRICSECLSKKEQKLLLRG